MYINADELIIQTEGEPPGCGGAVGVFHIDPKNPHPHRYIAIKNMPAIGIRITSKNTFFYQKRGQLFSRRKSYVIAGDVVAVLAQSGEFSHGQFTDPDAWNGNPGKVTTGWIRTRDLEDPFHSSLKH